MRAGRLYRHPRCLDVDIHVVKVAWAGPVYVRVRVLYWHRSLKTFLFLEPETVYVQRKDLPRWKDVTDHEAMR